MREYNSTKALFDKIIQQADAARIKHIQIAIGEISELDLDVVQQHWGELGRGTILEHSQLRFRSITAEAQCMACFQKYHPEKGVILCPNCGSFGAKILRGEEFHVEHIETDNE